MAKHPLVIRDGYCLFLSGFLSNWAHYSFVLDGVTYNCVEQAFMAAKAKQAGDTETLDLVMATSDCKEQKRLGRATKNFVSEAWDDIKFDSVYRACLAKFDQNPDIKQQLLATGNLILAEAADYDTVWGIGLAADHPDATNPSKWKGTNLLGQILMKVRANLKND